MSTLRFAVSLDTAHLNQDQPPLAALRELAAVLERAGATAVVLRDALVARGAEASGGLDASLAAAALAPVTRRLGLIPEVPATVTEPFHTATALQSIDHASLGRAGLLITPATDAAQHAAHARVPREIAADPTRLRAAALADAAHTLEAVNRLWESWEPDAEIRDAPTGRFLDRRRIHDAAFASATFSVEGASITPRSPQGRPPVVVRVTAADEAALAGQRADVAVLDPRRDLDDPALPGAVRALADAVLAEASAQRHDWATAPAPALWLAVPAGTYPALLARTLTAARAEAGHPLAAVEGLLLHATPEQHTPEGLAAWLGAAEHDETAHASPAATLRETLGLAPAINPFTAARATPAHQEA